MDIKWSLDDMSRAAQITIDLEPGDDPDSHITGLLTLGRLEAFLRAYPRPLDLGAPADQAEARDLLARFAFVTSMCAARLEALQLAAHDQWGLGWGSIARAVEASRSTVKGQIQAARGRYAAQGAWYDRDGFHRGTVDDAATAFDKAIEQDADDK